MGLFDSLIIKCPECKKELEFQSKSGPCGLYNFTKDDLPPEVGVDMADNIVKCQFCGNNFRLDCGLPKVCKVKLIKTKEKEGYPGNYNPDLPSNIKRMKELRKLLRG